MKFSSQQAVIGGVFLLALSPLVYVPGILFPAVAGKGFFVLMIASIVSASFAIAFLRHKPLFSTVPLSVYFFFAFLLWTTLTSLLGVHPLKSFSPSYERMDGILMLGALFGAFVSLLLPFFSQAAWKRLLIAALTAGGIVSFFALVQALLQLPHPYLTVFFGNPALLASYLVLLPFLALFALQSGVKGKTMRGFAFLLVAVDVLLLLVSGVRGALIAFIAGIAVVSIEPFLRRGASHLKSILIAIPFLFIIAGGVFGFVVATSPRADSFSHAFSRPLAVLSEEPRALLWGIGLSGALERPFLGWGYQSFDAVFEKHYNPLLAREEQWSDSSHNAYIDALVAGGAVGLLLYLGIFFFGFLTLWKRAPETLPGKRASARNASLLAGLVVAYAVNNFFVFPTLAPTLIVLGVIAYGASRGMAWKERPCVGNASANLATLVPIWGIVAFVALLSASSFGAGWFVAQANDDGYTLPRRAEFLKSALALPTVDPSGVRTHAAEAVVRLGSAASFPVFFHNENATPPLPGSSRLLYAEGVASHAQGDFETASVFLEAARMLAPNHITVRRALAEAYRTEGLFTESLAEYEAVFKLESLFPKTSEFQYYIDQTLNEYAAALVYAGREEEGEVLLTERYGAGLIPYTPELLAAYDAVNNSEKALALLETARAQEPDDPQHCFSLAAAELKFGRQPDAINTLRLCGETFPGSQSQADSIIRQIFSGTIDLNAL